ncbi:ATP-binding cassette domain-containing protein [Mesorhizobium sp. M0435]|uniref:ATP-binding cassette domain-containing protein n=1 Tax=Mesorhizobium sp. M0435 TaxID=2956944 RepID=UPI00333D76BF
MEVSDLQTVFWSRGTRTCAANGVNFHLNRSELLGVVGESGSGKSVTMIVYIHEMKKCRSAKRSLYTDSISMRQHYV